MEADAPRTKMKVIHGPHPAPEVTAREATDDQTPKVAATFRKSAQEAGWEVTTTYARGCPVDGHGKPGALCHSIALRMTRGAQYAVAIWTCPVGGSPKWTLKLAAAAARWTCHASGKRGMTPVAMKSTELKAFIKADPPTGEIPEEAIKALSLLAA